MHSLYTTTEGEPPSLRQRIRYTSTRNFNLLVRTGHSVFAYIKARFDGRIYPKVVFKTSFILVSAYLLVIISVPRDYVLSAGEREHADYTLNKYLDPSSISSNLEISNLQVVSRTNVGNGGTGGPADTSGASSVRSHTVVAGETLSGIAAQYNMSSGSLVLANKDLQDTELIHIGQILSIPTQEASASDLAKEKQDRQAKLNSKVKVATRASGTTRTFAKTSTVKADQSYRSPLAYSYISQGFSSAHHGEDMVAAYGTPIHATKSGCIISAGGGWNGGYGNLVVQDLGGGISARYAHLSRIADGITAGSCVEQGEVVGYLGTTGHSTGPHLHFELRSGGVAFNPGM